MSQRDTAKHRGISSSPDTRSASSTGWRLTVWCLAALSLVLGSGTVLAEIYRWVDEHGKVHFSDTKPADSPTDLEQPTIVQPEISAPAAEPDVGEMRRRRYLEGASALPEDLPESGSATPATPQFDQVRCDRARVEYAILQETVPVYRTRAGEIRANWVNDTHEGERVYITESERPQELDAASQRMFRFCADPGNEAAYLQAWDNYVNDIYCADHRTKVEHAATRRSRTPRRELARLEAEYRAKCG